MRSESKMLSLLAISSLGACGPSLESEETFAYRESPLAGTQGLTAVRPDGSIIGLAGASETLSIPHVDAGAFNAFATTEDPELGSVTFSVDGVRERREKRAPFSLFGDSSSGFNAGTLPPGTYVVTIEYFRDRQGRDRIGAFDTVLVVAGEDAPPSPEPPPESEPPPEPGTPPSPEPEPEPAPAPAPVFPEGRIAISSDGNGDPDDVGAGALGLVLLNASGQLDRLVHVDYNNNTLGRAKTNRKDAQMVETYRQGAERFDIGPGLFFDAKQAFLEEGEDNAASRNLAAQIDASTRDNPLYIVAAGPMEIIYQAVSMSEPEARAFVRVISHSAINDANVQQGGFRTRVDVEALGVRYVDIRDQNRGFATHRDFGPWQWMQTHQNPDVRWVYDRMIESTKADVSDAGMVWFLLFDDEDGDRDKLRAFFGR
ncbi:MAG: hypothetical protein AAFU79_14840 [Myxococcota bacterium]